MLSNKQFQQIKAQLLSQLEKTNLPNKEEITNSIEAMNSEQLEEFLKQNELIKEKGDQQQCIFCSIASGETQAFSIGENEEAIAVLEINPISKGHSIIIPKVHSEESSSKAYELATEISKKIKEIFNPKKVETHISKLFGHEIINILPVYKNETLESEKKSANPKELEKIQNQIKEAEIKEEVTPKSKKEIISDKTHWLPRRVP